MLVSIWNPDSSIARAFMDLCTKNPEFKFHFEPDECAQIHLICEGALYGKELTKLGLEEINETWHRNFTDIAKYCDRVFDQNRFARICIIGSYSAMKGSFDMAYAGAKAAMHLYIEKKVLNSRHQQLVGIAPWVIWDSGMTQRRDDLDQLAEKGANLRREQWLYSREVARLAYFLLLEDTGSICNTVIEQTGGN